MFELYHIISGFNITLPSLNTPDKLGSFISENLNIRYVHNSGLYSCLSTLVFTKDQIDNAAHLISSLFASKLGEYRVFRNSARDVKMSLQSLYFKTQINDYNNYALHRFTEIENLIKNMIRLKNLDSKFSTRKILKRIQIPDIYPEPIFPVINKKNIGKPKGLCPDPLLESFRYKTHRDFRLRSHEIEYCSYTDDTKTAEIITSVNPITADEIGITRSLANQNMSPAIIAVSKDGMKILQSYPTGFWPSHSQTRS